MPDPLRKLTSGALFDCTVRIVVFSVRSIPPRQSNFIKTST